MAKQTYTIKAGDTLYSLAEKFGTTVNELVKLNGIKNANVIYAGDTLIISDDAAEPSATNTSNKAIVTALAIQTGASDKTVYAVWDWDRTDTEKYEVRWYYDSGDKTATGTVQWWIGTKTTVDDKQSIYNAPANAIQVRVVVKPIAKTTNNKTPWTAEWSTEKIFTFEIKPDKPSSSPSITIQNYTLTVSLNNIDLNATHIQFEVVRDNDYVMYLIDPLPIKQSYVSYSCTITLGSEYKVRYRGVKDGIYGAWSDYSDNKSTRPGEPTLNKCSAKSKTSVYLEWSEVNTATGYEIEYAEKAEYFDNTDSTTTVDISRKTTYHTITSGLGSGKKYYFRVRAVNDAEATVTDGNKSTWSNILSVTIGAKPSAPTTWSSTVTAIVGEDVTLYWVHNSADSSSQTYAQLELYINGSSSPQTILVQNTTDEDKKDLTSKYLLPTSVYLDGASIQWRVRTAGVLTDASGNYEYGDWSITRVINIYAKPTVALSVKNFNGDALNYKLTSFPFTVKAVTGPSTQSPIGYHVSIVSLSTYETTDYLGNPIYVKEGDEIYANHFDTDEDLEITFSAYMLDLEPNEWYQIVVTASMDSGLTASATYDFLVNWADVEYSPNAEISINKNSLVARIGPYCEDNRGVLIPNLTMSVYRREYDGNFVEIAKDVPNQNGTYVTDPHPALDYARYRIISRDTVTGAVSYYDMPGVFIGEKAAVIQWDEAWRATRFTDDDISDEAPWAGSMLKLLYNLDVSNTYRPDVSHVEYIGRSHPVAYHGTHIGESQTWNVEILEDDQDSLYLLRRLAIWMGNVYVREPSGAGYWATVTVSWPKKHKALTIPVTINVTRVEGGM